MAKSKGADPLLEGNALTAPRTRASEVAKIMGANLKIQRLRLGLSQTQLGEFVNVTFQQIQKYESGRNSISSAMLYDFSLCLNVPVSNFYEGLELRKSSSPITPTIPSLHYKEVVRILDAFSSIKDKKLRQSLLNTIKTIGEQGSND